MMQQDQVIAALTLAAHLPESERQPVIEKLINEYISAINRRSISPAAGGAPPEDDTMLGTTQQNEEVASAYWVGSFYERLI